MNKSNNNIFELTPDYDFRDWVDPAAAGFELYPADRWRSELVYSRAVVEDLPELRAALGEALAEELGIREHSPEALIGYLLGRDPGLIEELLDIYELEDTAELCDYEAELMDHVDDETLDAYIKHLGYIMGTVGYSQWAYYIARPDVKESYIRDYWEGWSWYDIMQYSHGGDVVDVVGGIYAPTDEDITEAITDCFEFDGPVLVVDNEATSYSGLPKVKKISHVSYTFSGEEVSRCS